MFANIDETIILDVERYDLEPNLPIMNGLLGDMPNRLLNEGCLTETEKHNYAVLFVGKENVSQRALNSVKNIGKTLVGRPQLSAAVTISGGISAYLSKQIILKQHLPSGRKIVKFNENLSVK